MKPTGLFVTGTDTGVGKTVVTAAIAAQLREAGEAVAVRKPVATGARWVDGRWLAEDTERLAAAVGASGDADELARITPWAFPDPVAPPVAARRAGVRLTLADLTAAARTVPARDRMVLVEGVGGLLCPLTEDETVADLARALGLPLLVVARRALGTLNHTLLTVEAALTRGLAVVGVVVSETTPPTTLAEATNLDELRRRLPVPLLAVAAHRPGAAGSWPDLAAVAWRHLGRP